MKKSWTWFQERNREEPKIKTLRVEVWMMIVFVIGLFVSQYLVLIPVLYCVAAKIDSRYQYFRIKEYDSIYRVQSRHALIWWNICFYEKLAEDWFVMEFRSIKIAEGFVNKNFTNLQRLIQKRRL